MIAANPSSRFATIVATGVCLVFSAGYTAAQTCPGVDLLVSQGWPVSGSQEYYYGGDRWPELTAAIDGFAHSVTLSVDLRDPDFMDQFDALWIDQRDCNDPMFCWGPGELDPVEEANVVAFISTGRRVVIVGDNQNWWDWNNQVLGLLGGDFGGDTPQFRLHVSALHDLTYGVSEVYVYSAGYATGGLSLFEWNFATVWGATVLTLLDLNQLSNDSSALGPSMWQSLDNAQFGINVARWIACVRAVFADGFETGDTSTWSAGEP